MDKPGEPTPMQFGEPAPIPNGLPSMHDLVMQDMAARKDFGFKKYQALLQPFNGRDPLKDLYEELMDALVYVRQALYERDNPRPKPAPRGDVAVHVDNPGRCYCGGPEEVMYGHVYGKGRFCRERVEGGK